MNGTLIAVFPPFLACPAAPPPPWVEFEERTSRGLSYIHITIDPSQSSFEVTSQPGTTATPGQSPGLFFNGGYFEVGGKPSGLVISSGQTLSPKSDRSLLSGVFIIRNGKAQLVKSEAFVADRSISFALQNGPLVIEPGGKRGIRSDDGMRAERTILALDRRGKVHLIVIKTPTSLFQAQALLMRDLKDVHVAINLDGGPSSFFSLKTPQNSPAFGSPTNLPYLIKVTPR